MPLGKVDYEVPFSITGFIGTKKPVHISIVARTLDGQVFSASTLLRYLPHLYTPTSVSRIDHLHGKLSARMIGSSEWEDVFPYSFYVTGPWLRQDASNVQKLYDSGFNVLHIVPGGGLGYKLSELDAWLDECDRIGMWIMLDMRWSYQVPKNVEILVDRVRHHKRLLLWYTADEPG